MSNLLLCGVCALLAMSSAPVAQETRPAISPAFCERVVDASARARGDVRDRVRAVGLLGRHTVVQACLVSESGHLMAPRIDSVDGEAATYVLYRSDGSRALLETVDENRSLALVLLRSADARECGQAPRVGGGAPLVAQWFLVPSVAPVPLLGEFPLVHLGSLHHLPANASRSFTLSGAHWRRGTAVFDLGGRIVGIVERVGERNSVALGLSRVASKWQALAEVLPEAAPAGAPSFERLDGEPTELDEQGAANGFDGNRTILAARERFAGERMPAEVSYGFVLDEGEPRLHGAMGIVVDAAGLVLTRASAVGPRPRFLHGGNDYVAVLLALDRATGMALLAVEGHGLPAIQWSNDEPSAGDWLHAPTLGANGGGGLTVGTAGYELPQEGTIHAIERGTSLGLIPEQAEVGLRAVALTPGGPAASAGVRLGDRLVSFNGLPLSDRAALQRALAYSEVAASAQLRVERAGVERDLEVELAAAWPLPLPTGVTLEGGRLASVPSVWRGPIEGAWVHDLVLSAWDCGAPILDSSGGVVGVAVAVLGPGRTACLPTSHVRAALGRMFQKPLLR